MPIVIREPVVDDVEGMARVHVDAWRETYRGQMPDAVLDDPGLLERRRAMWRSFFTPEKIGRASCRERV